MEGRPETGASSATLAARALLQIVTRKLDAAEELLRAAIKPAPATTAPGLPTLLMRAAELEQARLESDLAAVELSKASGDDGPYALTSALAAADHAVHLDSRLPEASFNLALVEERLFLVSHSAAEWRRYLALDGTSAWASEAKRHLANLSALGSTDWQANLPALDAAALSGDLHGLARLVARFRQQARMHAERDLFPEWARSAARGDETRAAKTLRRLSAIARALRDQTGDRQLDEAASLLRQAAGGQRQALIAGHLAYARAVNLTIAEHLDAAERDFRRAHRYLASAGSPFALWADFQQALVAYYEKRTEEALRSARDLAAMAEVHSYIALAGRSNWLAAMILLGRTEASAALDALHSALAQFERDGEIANRASISSMLAINWEYLGAPREAWKLRLQALRDVVLAGDQGRATVLFGSAAQALAREGMPEAGSLFADEVLDRDLASGKPLAIAEAFWIRGLIHHQARADREAAGDLREASRYCQRIGSVGARRHTAAIIATVEGAVLRSADPAAAARNANPAAAVRTLTRALRLFRAERFPFLDVDVLRERALALLALGDLDGAEADLVAGIEEYERQRGEVHGTASRVSFFDRAEDVFDVMIRSS